ncbi:putative queuosine salvage protein [Elsinoe fawcettii]|nr:putative queuosine salvage protein [Elsinoe fawcettii]
MSDDEADPELLELLRKSLGIKPKSNEITSETKVLRDAEYIYGNAIDVAIDRAGTVNAAELIWEEMQRRSYSTAAWSGHELHPKAKDEATLNFIFTMDLLNFSFWSELPEEKRWSVHYREKRWTGYWSLVAALQRALDEGIPITTPSFWLPKEDKTDEEKSLGNQSEPHEDKTAVSSIDVDQEDPPEMVTEDEDAAVTGAEVSTKNVEDSAHDVSAEDSFTPAIDTSTLSGESIRYIFRGEGEEGMPLLLQRLDVLREAGQVLHNDFEGNIVHLLKRAENSAGKLVNLLAHHFACFRDEAKFDRKKVRFLKRPQILVADLWAAFEGKGYGEFHDIDNLTMFADYRVPQQLHSLGCLSYSPKLDHVIRSQQMMESGSSWECQLRGCSIWVVELMRRQILASHPEANINAVLIDFFLYDLAKEKEKEGGEAIPHHRTRSIWY